MGWPPRCPWEWWSAGNEQWRKGWAGTGSPQARPPFTGWGLGGAGWLAKAKGRGGGNGFLEGISHRSLLQEAVIEVEEGLLGLLGAQ